MGNKINTRADLKTERGARITDKHMAVYFAYLVLSHRNPSGQEKHRYLYLKDISKKVIGQKIGVSQPTIRTAEQRLEEAGYIYYSPDRDIIFFPDHNVFSWIPIESLTALLELSRNKEGGGDIIRLYAALHYLQKEEENKKAEIQGQSFSARTWVYAFGMSEQVQGNYVHIHILLYLLQLYGFITYNAVYTRAKGGKTYLMYTDVKVLEPKELHIIDEESAPLSEKVEEYRRLVLNGIIEKQEEED